ncbi:MAG: response regulator [Deltaproteobacteria bacterium]
MKNDLKKMHMDWFTLRFTGPDAILEQTFYQYYATRTLLPLRITLVTGILVYGAFGILDALMMPDHKTIPWLIRYAVVCPSLAVMLGITYFPRSYRYIQPIMSFIVALGGLGIVAMIAIAPLPVNYFYYAGLILVFIFGYTFVYLRFLWASLSGWIIVASYEMTAWFTGTPTMVLISNSFFLISANLAGMLACYNIEYAHRRNYFLTRLLDQEQQKIRETNELLEQRVAERTETLERTNRRLTQEINDRQLLESQLKQAEKMETIGNLAASVAHDLNNILVGLVGYPDLLLMKIPAASPLRQDIIRIQNSGQRASAMVQDLLALARRGVADKEVIQLNELLGNYLQTTEIQQLQKEHPRVTLETKFAADLLNIRAVPGQLHKTLMNLLTNAAEATMAGGSVLIATSNRYLESVHRGLETVPPGEYVVLSIHDNGIGIPAQDQKKIFEPFYTKKRMGRSGTGLGMTVVWNTVKDMEGFIDVISAEGKGTTIELILPVTREELKKIPERVFVDDLRGDERVLIVDDVAEQRDIASCLLEKLGYRVMTAGSGEEAVALLVKNDTDIAVLDMIMDPGIDGCETYRQMISIKPTLKAIMVSGFSESSRVKEAQSLGAGAYVNKPYTMEKLAVALRMELNRTNQL